LARIVRTRSEPNVNPVRTVEYTPVQMGVKKKTKI
jgi:hypothetical protein